MKTYKVFAKIELLFLNNKWFSQRSNGFGVVKSMAFHKNTRFSQISNGFGVIRSMAFREKYNVFVENTLFSRGSDGFDNIDWFQLESFSGVSRIDWFSIDSMGSLVKSFNSNYVSIIHWFR